MRLIKPPKSVINLKPYMAPSQLILAAYFDATEGISSGDDGVIRFDSINAPSTVYAEMDVALNMPQTGIDAINGENVISFLSKDYMRVHGLALSGDFEIMMIAKTTASDTGIQYFYTPDGSQSGYFCEFRSAGDISGFNVNGALVAGNNLAHDTAYNLLFRQIDGVGYIYENGVLMDTEVSALEITADMEIGRNGYPFYLKGAIGTLVIRGAVDIAGTNYYGQLLSEKWGTAWTDLS